MDDKQIRKEILEEWADVLGIQEHYEFYNGGRGDGDMESSITIGISAYSLKSRKEKEFLLTFRPEEICLFVEDFLNEYNEIYLNYLINQVLPKPE